MQEIAGHVWGSLLMGGALFALLKLFLPQKKEAATSVADTMDPRLRQALETKHCGLCKRGCPLSTPRCRRGIKQRDAFIANFTSR
jgi:hypothetical protein